MVNLERICKDFARITCDNVDPGGGGQSMVNWEQSAKTLQGLPLTMLGEGNQWLTWGGKDQLLILGVNCQLGKDLQRLCKDYL